jgi:hypothetical protein
MANDKLTLANADAASLLGNLRGELGEAITAWLLMRNFIVSGQSLQSGNLEKDPDNKQIQFAQLMSDKLADELVGRLSELAERKIGQLTFFFAARKLNVFLDHVLAFEKFIIGHKIRKKRNQDVSHKVFPATKDAPKQSPIHVPYKTLVRAVALAVRLMKRMDRQMLGPSAPFLWREARKKRYDFMSPPRAGYMLLPYLKLSREDRLQIVQLELAEGREVWTELPTTIDGHQTKVLACKPWGVIILGGYLLALDTYPLVALPSISTGAASPLPGVV